jgi:putative serine protease PepD
MPKSLWSDRQGQRGDEHEWLAAPVSVRTNDPEPAPEPAPPRKKRAAWVAPALSGLVAAVAVALVLVGFDVVGGDDSSGGGEQTGASTLPAAPPIQGNGTSANAAAIYQRAAGSVASIRSSSGTGTGFVADTDGIIVTNAHVIGDDKSVKVKFGAGTRARTAIVVGRDTSTDLAVLKINGDTTNLNPLPLANSDNVKPGDPAVAIGNPLGLDRTVTAGIVSAVGRPIKAPNGFDIDDAIQTDAPINPGNSGGPLLDSGGRVIGVNSQIATAGSQGNIGIGFAVSSNVVREVIPRLEQGNSIRRAYMGVSTSDSVTGQGAEVATVEPGKPAEKAGIEQGDIITRVDGERVASSADVARLVQQHKPGEEVEVEVERFGDRRSFTVKLGTRPANAP